MPVLGSNRGGDTLVTIVHLKKTAANGVLFPDAQYRLKISLPQETAPISTSFSMADTL